DTTSPLFAQDAPSVCGMAAEVPGVHGAYPSAEVTGAEAKRFLADLAVRRQVSASAQNQAFNALLFLFRHVLAKELGDLSDTPRAKRSKSIPTVLSRQEVERLLAELKAPYQFLAM